MRNWKLLLCCLILPVFAVAQKKTVIVNVRSCGAKGDGKSNDTQSLLSAFKQIAQSGGTVYFPAGRYVTDIIDIRPKPGVTISVTGDYKKSVIIKSATDKTNIALFFCEIKGVVLKFRNLTLNGSSSSKAGKWHSADRQGVVLDDEINGIYVYNVASLNVSDCQIADFHGKGIAAYNCRYFTAEKNTISNVNGSAIQGHRVLKMRTINNLITNTGFVSANDLVDNKHYYSSLPRPATLFGDGIEAECDQFTAIGNRINNPGRCGITHDLAKDLGYTNSSAIVSNNTIVVNSGMISNHNPPAGMWFEQSATVMVTNNTITFKRSSSKFVSGIRFYDVTGQITCNNNIIDATAYNHVADAGIGIYEPSVKAININKNKVTGKFSQSVILAYGNTRSKVEQFLVAGNSFSPVNDLGGGLKIAIGGRCSFPVNSIINANDFLMAMSDVYKLSYYGLLPFRRQTKAVFKIKDNKVRGAVNNTLPPAVQGLILTK